MQFIVELAELTLVVLLSSYVLAKACNSFEGAADFLGRNLPAGIKGATINAVGSSLPELFTTLALLFFMGGAEVFGAGVAVTAGSAVFNSEIIPFLCIVAVIAPGAFRLVLRILSLFIYKGAGRSAKVDYFEIDKKALLRDGAAFFFAQMVLIYMLNKSQLTWVDGLILMSAYLPYVAYMKWQSSKAGPSGCKASEDEKRRSKTSALVNLEFNSLLFGGKAYSESRMHRPWIVLGLAIVSISIACYFLSEAIVGSADLFGVSSIITALFLGAAASSVPDTILSVKDSMKGNYNDAISNALGSNTFNICVALGLPLCLYGLMFGPVPLPHNGAILGLQIALGIITAVILLIFLVPRRIRLWQAGILGALYLVWTAYILLFAT